MNTRYFIPAAAFMLLLSACNNTSEKKETKEDTVMNNMDTMQHSPSPTATVPALPPVPDGAKVIFANLKEGATIRSPFNLKMGAAVIKIDTAGPVIAGIGHHHLFIDAEDSLMAGEMVPKDSTHIHFGKGQTEYELVLTPGKHKLTLQMADGLHRSYGSRLAATVNVTVK